MVDPGVGTSRNPLLVVTPWAIFFAPDNGVLSYVLKEGLDKGNEGRAASQACPKGGERPCPEGAERVALPNEYRAYHLTNPEFWLHPVSATFHGRDIFAPVAAHLSLGVPPDRLGRQVKDAICLRLPQPSWDGATLVGQVAHIDRFGNLVTNIPAGTLPSEGSMTVEVKGAPDSRAKPFLCGRRRAAGHCWRLRQPGGVGQKRKRSPKLAGRGGRPRHGDCTLSPEAALSEVLPVQRSFDI